MVKKIWHESTFGKIIISSVTTVTIIFISALILSFVTLKNLEDKYKTLDEKVEENKTTLNEKLKNSISVEKCNNLELQINFTNQKLDNLNIQFEKLDEKIDKILK